VDRCWINSGVSELMAEECLRASRAGGGFHCGCFRGTPETRNHLGESQLTVDGWILRTTVRWTLVGGGGPGRCIEDRVPAGRRSAGETGAASGTCELQTPWAKVWPCGPPLALTDGLVGPLNKLEAGAMAARSCSRSQRRYPTGERRVCVTVRPASRLVLRHGA
jgi:hypothetical protein